MRSSNSDGVNSNSRPTQYEPSVAEIRTGTPPRPNMPGLPGSHRSLVPDLNSARSRSTSSVPCKLPFIDRYPFMDADRDRVTFVPHTIALVRGPSSCLMETFHPIMQAAASSAEAQLHIRRTSCSVSLAVLRRIFTSLNRPNACGMSVASDARSRGVLHLTSRMRKLAW